MRGLVSKPVLPGLILSLLLCGCGKNAADIEEADKSEIRAMISGSEWFESEGHFGEEDTSGGVGLSPIEPAFWWRTIDIPVDRAITVDLIGDSAFVTVVVDINGHFNILAEAGPDTLVHIRKDLADTVTRYGIFKRYAEETKHRGWRLYKLSGAESISDVNSVAIDSIRIESATYDTTLTDPLALFLKEDALTFGPGEQCNLKVYTNDSTAFLFLHTFRPYRPCRWRLLNNGDGTYSGFWFAPLRKGIFHFAADMIQHETLYDDVHPYDSNCWLLPYKVE